MGVNEPISMSFLGLFANDCANKFCNDKDGLELWLSLIQESSNNSIMMNEKYNRFIFSPLYTGIVCASVGYLSFIMTYYITTKWLNNEV
jgi:hypothetical protein